MTDSERQHQLAIVNAAASVIRAIGVPALREAIKGADDSHQTRTARLMLRTAIELEQIDADKWEADRAVQSVLAPFHRRRMLDWHRERKEVMKK